MPYTPTSDQGYVRLLVTDTGEDPIFSDQEITAFIGRNPSSLKRAAAEALSVMARSEVLISKKITTQDLSTDGPAVAAELRASAKALRDEADADEAKSEDVAFTVEPFHPGGCGRPELTEYPQWSW